MPHGHCYLWLPEILWTHVTSDAIIAAAYYSIPVSIVAFLRKRRDIELRAVPVPIMFSAFIFLCGTSHLLAILVVWNGYYGIHGMVKAATAILSIITAVTVWRLLPAALAIPSNNQLTQEIASATDTLQERNEQLSAANIEIQHFVSAASHDLKEPLRTLVAYCQLLEKDMQERREEDIGTDLRHIAESAKRMQALVDDLLDLSLASRDDISFEMVRLDKCVDEVLLSLQASIRESRAIIERPELPLVMGDPVLLSQLFQNLISNALRFAHPEIRPRIAITLETNELNERVFGVLDNGPGIEGEHHAAIFQPYKRLHGQDHSTGSGLGLAICRRAIERHNGRIWVENVAGGGAHFRFVINCEGNRQDAGKPAQSLQTENPGR